MAGSARSALDGVMAPPAVSIVVPCYSGEATLARCLQSLLAQQTTLAIEIIVVLNNSPDRSAQVAGEIARASDGRIRVVTEPCQGVAAARNCGLQAARAPVILFTDADCSVGPSWVEALSSALHDPTVLLAGGMIVGEPEQTALVARYSRYQRALHPGPCLTHPVGPFLQTANLAVRRDDALAVGGFDVTLAAGEDADFCWRLQRARPAGRVALVVGARVTHMHRENVRALFRQYAVYGWADAALARRYGVPWRWGVGAALRLARDLLRIAAAPLLALLGGVIALCKRDPLPAAIPLLLVVTTLARKFGQIEAIRGRWPVYLPPVRAGRGEPG